MTGVQTCALPIYVKIKKAKEFISGKPLKTAKAGRHDVVLLPELPDSRDFIIECEI